GCATGYSKGFGTIYIEMTESHGSIQTLYPWQQEQWQRIQQSRAASRLPHALLLTGPAGVGKSIFAVMLANSLLCLAPTSEGTACGCCQNCQLLHAGSHPDFIRIEPEEPGKAIRIDTIREFTAKEALTSQSGGYKVIIIEPADAMNIAASNSLLKTLEEPTARTLMILISSHPVRLPATIRSRCQSVHFPTPERAIAKAWLDEQLPQTDTDQLLNFSAGSPLQALALSQGDSLALRGKILEEFSHVLSRKADPVAVAANWASEALEQLIPWLSGWLMDMVRLKMVPNTQMLTNIDQKQHLQALASTIELKALYLLLDKLLEMNRTLGSQLNNQMLLEDLLLSSVSVTARKAS
ncbi:MAG: DNA polymerase III subunit delta', partial [Chromatiales bacterium]|nr:DNA polymerase III subunit delta' [Chromatiales bacterium]